MSADGTITIATYGDLIEQGYGLQIHCGDCRWTGSSTESTDMGARIRAMMREREAQSYLRRRYRCPSCGGAAAAWIASQEQLERSRVR